MALPSFPANMTLAQVMEFMKGSKEELETIDNDIRELLTTRTQLEAKIDMVSFPSTEVAIIRDETKKMLKKVSSGSISASSLSKKVRSVDVAQHRLGLALVRVESVLNLKNTIAAVEQALIDGDYEVAAQHTHRVLKLENPLMNEVAYGVLVSLDKKVREQVIQECESAQMREDLEKTLHFCRLFPLVGLSFRGLVIYCQTVRQTVSGLLENGGLRLETLPANAVLQFADLLTKTLDIIAGGVQSHLGLVQSHFCPGAHLRILQELQGECDQQVVPLLRRFIKDKELLSTVKKVKGLKQQRAKMQLPGSRSQEKVKDDGGVDPRVLDSLLEEITYICRESEIFDANIRQLGKQAKDLLNTSSAAPSPPSSSSPPPPSLGTLDGGATERESEKGSEGKDDDSDEKQTGLLATEESRVAIVEGMAKDKVGFGQDLAHASKSNEVVQEIIGNYISLEEFYMVQNIQKAIQIDEHIMDEDDDDDELPPQRGVLTPIRYNSKVAHLFSVSLTSSMVDDIFYILKKCTERAFATCNVSGACAIVNHINAMLSRDYMEVLQARLKLHGLGKSGIAADIVSNLVGKNLLLSGSISNVTKVLGGVAGIDPAQQKIDAAAAVLVTINNIQVSTQYILTLKRHLEGEFQDTFGQEETKTMLKHCLNDMKETSDLFSKAGKKAIAQLLASLEAELITPSLELFNKQEYQLNDESYNTLQNTESWVQHFIQVLDLEFTSLRRCLTDTNFDTFVATLAQYIVKRVEGSLVKKSFTLWGGLQLDKELRQLNTFFSDACQFTVRDKFSRLVQISSIVLQLEKVEDILDYWGDAEGANEVVWRLTGKEVRRFLGLRVDFSPSDIRKLQL